MVFSVFRGVREGFDILSISTTVSRSGLGIYGHLCACTRMMSAFPHTAATPFGVRRCEAPGVIFRADSRGSMASRGINSHATLVSIAYTIHSPHFCRVSKLLGCKRSPEAMRRRSTVVCSCTKASIHPLHQAAKWDWSVWYLIPGWLVNKLHHGPFRDDGGCFTSTERCTCGPDAAAMSDILRGRRYGGDTGELRGCSKMSE